MVISPSPVPSDSVDPPLTRDFTVATFVVHEAKVLLLLHKKLGMWLPPGGHIDPHELPDEAAVREVWEEAGLRVELVADGGVDVPNPRQLARPEGIQLERIRPGHEHIDLIYFARPVDSTDHAFDLSECDGGGWYSLDEMASLPATDEIMQWARRAIAKAR